MTYERLQEHLAGLQLQMSVDDDGAYPIDMPNGVALAIPYLVIWW